MKAEIPEEGEGGVEGGREKRDEQMCRSFLLIKRLILINTGSREGERKGGREDVPLCFKFLSVLANTIAALASWALVTQALLPFTIYSSPFSTAVVLVAPASLPLPGSDRQKQPIWAPEA